jgi:large subunit ribosomal protein L10
VIKGGLLGESVLDGKGVNALADVEPREVILAKLAGALAAPLQQFAGLLQALPRDFAYGLKALIDQGGAPGAPADAPAAAAADETPDAEAPAAADETPDAEAAAPADETAAEADEAPAADTDTTDTEAAESADTTESES